MAARMRSTAIGLTLALQAIACVDALAEEPRALTFIACPVYRDTDAGRKSGCWLATDRASGIRYDVTAAPIKPILGREILVEGVTSSGDSAPCGGPPLEPVRVAVLDTECKAHLLPAEGHPGRPFVLPSNVLQPAHVPRRLPSPPFDAREFTIYFTFNDDFLVYQHAETIIEAAVLYVQASKPREVLVKAYADTSGFEASGRRLREPLDVAAARARMVKEALVRLGVPEGLVKLQWKGDPEPDALAAEGLALSSERRATIVVHP